MRWLAIVIVVTAGCSNRNHDDGPAVPSRHSDCAAAYSEYERTWKLAWQADLDALTTGEDGTPVLDATTQRELIGEIVDTLPTRRELAKLRETHVAGNQGRSDPPIWLAAWSAAERAIEVCGEGAKRPTST